MQTEDIQLLVALGVLNPRADEMSAMIIWGMLLHDPIVWKRQIALPRDPQMPVWRSPGAAAAIAAMTAKEKESLRDRILAKCAGGKTA